MSDCLPDLPRYIRQFGDNEWQGADHQDGPWRPIPAPQSVLPWMKSAATEKSSVAQPLSPAAQAVMDAYETTLGVSPGLAAALRAAADQVVPHRSLASRTIDERTLYHEGRLDAGIRIRAELLAIAAELEGQP